MCLRDWMSEHVTTAGLRLGLAHFGAADSSSSSDSDSENGDNSPPSFASWHPHTGCGADRCWCGLPRDHTHGLLPGEKLQYEELQEENEDLRAENKAIRKEKQRLAALILSKGREGFLYRRNDGLLRRENDELRQQLQQAQEEYQGLSQAVGFADAWDIIHYKCGPVCRCNCSAADRCAVAPAPDSSSSSDSDSDDSWDGSDED